MKSFADWSSCGRSFPCPFLFPPAVSTLTLGDRLLKRPDVEKGNEAAAVPSPLPIWKDHRIVGTIAMLLMLAALWWLR